MWQCGSCDNKLNILWIMWYEKEKIPNKFYKFKNKYIEVDNDSTILCVTND